MNNLRSKRLQFYCLEVSSMTPLMIIVFFICSFVTVRSEVVTSKYLMIRNVDVTVDTKFETQLLAKYTASSLLTCVRSCKKLEDTCKSFYYNVDASLNCLLVSTSFIPAAFTGSTKSWQFWRERCPKDQACFWNEELGKCLCFFLVNKKTWSDARDYCSSQNGRLIIINNQAYHDFVRNTIVAKGWTSHILFVGASDIETEGTFKWLDGTLVTGTWAISTSYGQEPNGGNTENCMMLWSSQNVNFADVNCLGQQSYICEWVV